MDHYTITGGAGFIGSHLADSLLAAGATVTVLDDFSTGRRDNLDPRCRVIEADVADPAAVAAALEGAAGCFHLAAIASVVRSTEDWLGAHRTNQTGTITVMDAARRAGRIPVVYASSAAVYGDLGDRIASETLNPAPMTAYGADKLGSELHGRVAFQVHGVPTLGLRFFNVYGPRQDPASPYSGVISIFARNLTAGRPVTVHGDGGQTRDFVFVLDVVAHLTAGMHRLRQRPGAIVLNVCTGRGVSIGELAGIMSALRGSTPDIRQGPARAGDIRFSLGDPAAAMELLSCQAGVTLQDGLQTTLAHLAAAS